MNTNNYLNIKKTLIKKGYSDEMDFYENIKPCDNKITFFQEYVYVVINSGMKNQVARKIYLNVIQALINGDPISSVFKHEGKVKAITQVLSKCETIFNEYRESQDKLEYLKTLPWIGDITKYHLAKNLGFDVAKPDRHLIRIANYYNTTPSKLCSDLSQATGDKIATVDVVLWRAANLGIIKYA